MIDVYKVDLATTYMYIQYLVREPVHDKNHGHETNIVNITIFAERERYFG